MRTILKIVCLFALFGGATAAWAYIPKLAMILSRTVENHGRGFYVVEQEVSFVGGTDTYLVNETWTIENENNMRLVVTPKRGFHERFQLVYVYDGNKRYFLDESGARRNISNTLDWFEPYFYVRRSDNLKNWLNKQSILPSQALKKAPVPSSLKQVRHDEEPYVRLSRSGGTISFAVGTPSASAEATAPGLWIEQDNFVIRKLRLASKVEVKADNYNRYANDLWLPRSREVSWNNKHALISLVDVRTVGKSPEVVARLRPSSIENSDKATPTRLPEIEVVREFYARFR